MQTVPIEHEELELYLRPTSYIDSDHPSVRAFAEAAITGVDEEVTRAGTVVRLPGRTERRAK